MTFEKERFSWQPRGLLGRVYSLRTTLGLGSPGTFENLNRDLKQCFLNNYFFDGGRADLTKVISPEFQVTHSFSTGSSNLPPQYNFNAAYQHGRMFLQGSVDHEGMVQGRCNYQWSSKLISKLQFAVSPTSGASEKGGGGKDTSMIQAELDYQGRDFSVNYKALNPSPISFTGIHIVSFLQAVTPKLALGIEYILQKPTSTLEESGFNYCLKYLHPDRDAITVLQLQTPGQVCQASYWQRIDKAVDLGTELSISPFSREAVCSVGGRWEFAAASIRAMIDTKGRVQMALEERLAQGFAILINGELDHWKGQSRFGVGLQMET